MLLAMATLYAPAQTNGSNSPYSRFGLRQLERPVARFQQGYERSGIGIPRRKPHQYAKSGFLFCHRFLIIHLRRRSHVANVNFKSGGNSINAHNTTLDYINAGFRLCPGLGFSFGFIPFSSIGYDFSESKYLGDHFNSGSTMTYTNSYTGDGGLHEVYVGLGWNPFADFSVGANFGYVWGNYAQNITQTFMKTEQPPAQATATSTNRSRPFFL